MAFEYLHIVLVESDIQHNDKNENINTLKTEVLKHSCDGDVDVVAVPEMFSTGFINDAGEAYQASEKNTENTINQLHSISKTSNAAICGSFLAHTASSIFNRAFFIEPNSDETFYDKRHLFTMGGEQNVFTAGYNLAPVIRFRGWNIKVIICYDLRFPVFCRNKNNEYDVLVVVANWPKARQEAWLKLLAARAIENMCYVCGINRRGVDNYGTDFGCGSSVVIDYKGEIINQTSDSNHIIHTILSKGKLDNFRKKFPVYADADDFTIK